MSNLSRVMRARHRTKVGPVWRAPVIDFGEGALRTLAGSVLDTRPLYTIVPDEVYHRCLGTSGWVGRDAIRLSCVAHTVVDPVGDGSDVEG